MKIALVTYEDEGKYAGEGNSEDVWLQNYLNQKGFTVTFEVWNNPQVDWHQYDQVVIKSTWDYFDKINQFRQWLDYLDEQKINILNPSATVRWNTDKAYLLEVQELGFPVVPTVLLPVQSQFTPEEYFALLKTDKLILKPAVSGGAKNTFILNQTEAIAYQDKLNQLMQEEDYLVQPFMPEIQTAGEWSLLFFNGQFSHAVRKLPKEGDFRVQHYFGGAIIPASPPAAVLQSAQELVNRFAAGCLYARVDGLESQGLFYLMELELIEPLLYLQENPQLYENYYQALSALV